MKNIPFWPAIIRFAPLTLALLFAVPAIAQIQIIEFDDQTDGTILAGQYPLVTFYNSPMVVNVATRWSSLTTYSPPMGLYKGSSGPIRIQFARPQSRVRVYVGFPYLLAGRPCTAVMRAYALWPNDRHPTASSSIVFNTPSGVTNALEVLRPLDGDIGAVEVEFTGGVDLTLMDHLEAEIITPAYHGVVDFDTFPSGAIVRGGTRIGHDYPGVTFPYFPVAEPPSSVSTFSPPNALHSPMNTEFETAPLVMRFAPSQGDIRLMVGNPYENPQHIVMTAYSGVVEVGNTSIDLAPGTDIGYPLEIQRWYQRDIDQVLVQYSFGWWEYIDHLEFAPNLPLGIVETTPPAVYFDSPPNGSVNMQTTPVPPAFQPITLNGHIDESQGS